MTKPRKPRSDSLQAQVQKAQSRDQELRLPDNIELDNDFERSLWRQYTSRRDLRSWSESELLALRDLIKIETRIRQTEALLHLGDDFQQMANGAIQENPCHKRLDTLLKQKMSFLRLLKICEQNAGNNHGQTAPLVGRADDPAMKLFASRDDNPLLG